MYTHAHNYFGRWKALQCAARRFYAPVLLSVEDHSARMALFVTKDTAQPWLGEVRWSLETLAAGCTTPVRCPLPPGRIAAQAAVALRRRSLREAY
jgi:beta-mannosidase